MTHTRIPIAMSIKRGHRSYCGRMEWNHFKSYYFDGVIHFINQSIWFASYKFFRHHMSMPKQSSFHYIEIFIAEQVHALYLRKILRFVGKYIWNSLFYYERSLIVSYCHRYVLSKCTDNVTQDVRCYDLFIDSMFYIDIGCIILCTIPYNYSLNAERMPNHTSYENQYNSSIFTGCSCEFVS